MCRPRGGRGAGRTSWLGPTRAPGRARGRSARVQRCQSPGLLGDRQWPMIGQHHPSGTQANRSSVGPPTWAINTLVADEAMLAMLWCSAKSACNAPPPQVSPKQHLRRCCRRPSPRRDGRQVENRNLHGLFPRTIVSSWNVWKSSDPSSSTAAKAAQRLGGGLNDLCTSQLIGRTESRDEAVELLSRRPLRPPVPPLTASRTGESGAFVGCSRAITALSPF
jgi:hypothetical protein